MKILYDHQIFSHQRFGGVSRYFTNLINYANDDSNVEVKLGLVSSKNEYMPKPFDFISKRLGKKFYKRIISLNKATSRRLLKNYNYDVFHPTYYHPYFLPYLKDKPFVLTIYDMMPELFPDFFSSDFSDISRKKLLVKKADKIITISNQTKKDLMRLLSVEEEKISVVHLSANFNTNIITTGDHKIPDQYLLYVGTRKFYKNFTLFIKAISPILKKDRNLKLVLAGGGKLEDNEITKLKELNIYAQTIHYNKLTDTLLPLLYSKAKAFIFPSLYEGFGIPILEAFTYNCPVILSDTPVFKEIAQEGARYFNPRSEESIRFEIEEALFNRNSQQILCKNAKKILQEFTPQKTYKETLEIYKSLL